MTYPAPLPSLGSLFAPAASPVLRGGGHAAPFPWLSSLFAPIETGGGAGVSPAALARHPNRWLIRRGPLPATMYTIDIEKTPYEERTFAFDLSALLAPSETLASVDAVVVDPAGASVVTASGPVVAGEGSDQVRVRLAGGALPAVGPWSDHVVRVRAITSLGHKVEGLFRLRILEAPVS